MDGAVSSGSTSTPHGVKRRADDDLRDEQRLARRFNLLHLEQNGKVPTVSSSRNMSCRSDGIVGTASDSMQLDDTKEKVYIHNLEDQIAEIEAEEKTVFLPDIEKKLGKIPHYLLTGNLRPTAENQMVLYGVPASLSVPEERDNVRKAIIESRARAREKQLSDDDGANPINDLAKVRGMQTVENNIVTRQQQSEPVEDEDAMDLG